MFWWQGLAWGSEGKESAFSVGNPGLIPGLGRSPGGGNGNPLQYSCLENSMDRGAWWATVHGVKKNQTWLSNSQHILMTHTVESSPELLLLDHNFEIWCLLVHTLLRSDEKGTVMFCPPHPTRLGFLSSLPQDITPPSVLLLQPISLSYIFLRSNPCLFSPKVCRIPSPCRSSPSNPSPRQSSACPFQGCGFWSCSHHVEARVVSLKQ